MSDRFHRLYGPGGNTLDPDKRGSMDEAIRRNACVPLRPDPLAPMLRPEKESGRGEKGDSEKGNDGTPPGEAESR